MGKIKEIEYSFSAAKEIVYSPVILNNVVFNWRKRDYDMIMMLLFSDQRC